MASNPSPTPTSSSPNPLTSSQIDFDFDVYLHTFLATHPSPPSSSKLFTIQKLTGGVTNHTVRATFEPPVVVSFPVKDSEVTDAVGHGVQLTSVVMKHAPPYVAADLTQPLPVTRQLVEKMALALLHGDSGFNCEGMEAMVAGLREGLGLGVKDSGSAVRIPKLVWHDEQKDVLWIEDLGRVQTLSTILLSSSLAPTPESEIALRKQLERIARDLGHFLASLYHATAHPPPALLAHLRSLSDPSGVFDYLAELTRQALLGAGLQADDAEALVRRVRRGMEEGDREDGCLGMVDLWSESVLVDLDSEGGRCGLVDWEYFGKSSAPSELGMFLAHLHVHVLNSASSETVKDRIQAFVGPMFHAYVEKRSSFGDISTSTPIGWKPSNYFRRRVVLSHGRELVNGAEFYKSQLNEESRNRVVNAGIRSLRAAGEEDSGVDMDFLEQEEEGGMRRIWASLAALRFE